MLGKTHFAAGVCAGAVLTYGGQLEPKQAILAIAGTALGSLLPDIDHRNSTISHAVKPVGVVVSAVAGHRKLLHNAAFYAAVFAALFILKRDVAMLCVPLFIGIATHLFLDALNPAGIPVFKWRLHLAKIRTGSTTDRAVRVFCSILAEYYLIFFALRQIYNFL